MAEGIVLWGVKSIFYVCDNVSGKEYKCTIKGKILETDFDLKGRIETTPIVVGDIVTFDIVDESSGVILNKHKRRNEFKRLKLGGRTVQTIVANIDILAVVDSVVSPPLRPFFIDRCLFTADYMGIESVIIINKTDLIERAQVIELNKILKVYESLGYKTMKCSTINNKGLKEIKDLFTGKLVSFNGRSGVGKSSLIKTIDPSVGDIKIGDVSAKFNRGVHTTTYARIFKTNAGFDVIDTPGIRELSVFVGRRDNVESFFKDFDPFRSDCKFKSCQHIDEPGCAVKKGVESGQIADFRYESYLRIRETVFSIDDSKL